MTPSLFWQWWREAGRAAFGQTWVYLGLNVGIEENVRREIATQALRKTQLLAWSKFQRNRSASEAALTRWAIDRARREARRQLPLVREINTWLWLLPQDHRRILLLQYESLEAKEIGFVLGISTAAAQLRLDAARKALEAVIQSDGFEPSAWIGF